MGLHIKGGRTLQVCVSSLAHLQCYQPADVPKASTGVRFNSLVVIRDFIGRHFTWFSGTLVTVELFVILLLILLYVPAATANVAFNSVLTIGTVIFGALSALSVLLTIHDWISTRGLQIDREETDEPASETGLSSPAQGFVRTEGERMREAMDELDPAWFVIQENGTIEYRNEGENLSKDRAGALYVFAAQVGYESGYLDTPKVSKAEVRDAVEFTGASAGVFMEKMYSTERDEFFVNFDFDPEDPESTFDMDEEELTFKLNKGEVSEVVRYIKGDRRAPD